MYLFTCMCPMLNMTDIYMYIETYFTAITCLYVLYKIIMATFLN